MNWLVERKVNNSSLLMAEIEVMADSCLCFVSPISGRR